ncbi:hypothetical protein BT63DRAFT_481646 [Microthyrium microscopicum]|uniref:VOC domain-containing protein n=1 Tax=Microthyrium microscopicum TaxID=703497 RepID=A0A6A6U6Y9_9PEZI|nr:hypothetical protein BT63DRAFT_481646 [Microthyrium microscopicum]
MPVTHVGLTVSNLPSSTKFYLAALQPLGYRYIGQWGPQIGFGAEEADFFLTQEMAGMKAGGGHVAFSAPDRASVHEFFASAVEAGARPHGKPAQRYDGDQCFNSAVLDYDGNSIEVVYHESEMCGGASKPQSRVLSWRDDVVDSIDDATSIISQSAAGRSVAPKSTAGRSTVAHSVAGRSSAAKSVASRSAAAKSVVSVRSIQSAASSAAQQALVPATAAPSIVSRSGVAFPIITQPRAPPLPAPTELSAQTVLSTLHKSITGNGGSMASSLLGDSRIEMSTKTLAGTLLGAAAGAAVAYAMCKSEEDSAHSERIASIAASQKSASMIEPWSYPSPIIPGTPSHTPATSQYTSASRKTGMQALEGPMIPLSAYTGQTASHGRAFEYLASSPKSQYLGSSPQSQYLGTSPGSRVSAARSARRPSVTIEDYEELDLEPKRPSSHLSRAHTTPAVSSRSSSRVPSKASSKAASIAASQSTARPTPSRAASHTPSKQSSQTAAESHHSPSTTSRPRSESSKHTSTSKKSTRSGSSSKASKPKSGHHLDVVHERSWSPPADYTIFAADEDDESIVPSDSISNVGSTKRSKTSKRSKSSKSSSSTKGSSKHSEKGSRATSRKSESVKEAPSEAPRAETVTQKRSKERSHVSLPLRGMTPMGRVDGRTIASYAG